MGQQQLLLIVFGIIVVGIGVAVVLSTVNAYMIDSNRNAVILDLSNLGAMAQQFYMKPILMVGGENTFDGWGIPAGLDSTENGTYIYIIDIVTETVDQTLTLVLVGTGKEIGKDGINPVEVTANVTATTISIVENN